MEATPRKIARRRHLAMHGGADKAPGDKRKPWCTKRHTACRTWPVAEKDKPKAQLEREAARSDWQTRGVLLVGWLYRRAA